MTLQVSPAQVRYDASLRCPRDEIQLYQIRLDDDGHRLGIFTDRRSEAVETHRTTSELLIDSPQEPPIDIQQAILVDVEPRESLVDQLDIDDRTPRVCQVVSDAFQVPQCYARNAA